MERMELRCEELRVPSVYARSSTVLLVELPRDDGSYR